MSRLSTEPWLVPPTGSLISVLKTREGTFEAKEQTFFERIYHKRFQEGLTSPGVVIYSNQDFYGLWTGDSADPRQRYSRVQCSSHPEHQLVRVQYSVVSRRVVLVTGVGEKDDFIPCNTTGFVKVATYFSRNNWATNKHFNSGSGWLVLSCDQTCGCGFFFRSIPV